LQKHDPSEARRLFFLSVLVIIFLLWINVIPTRVVLAILTGLGHILSIIYLLILAHIFGHAADDLGVITLLWDNGGRFNLDIACRVPILIVAAIIVHSSIRL
jgi:hypothetical protein